MKKICLLLLAVCLFMVGCKKNSEDNIVKDLSSKVTKADAYHLYGMLEMFNNEDTYTYNVDVAYADDDNYRVSLTNQINLHEQIILKNSEGVYVLTPSLNKSFKFQSEWPYNNSQAYLLQTLINDIENDGERIFEETDEGYVFTTKVNYSNNPTLVKQKIYLDDDLNLKMVEVINEDDAVEIKMVVEKVDLKASYNDDYFTLESNLNSEETINTNDSIENIIYPMYIPLNTTLSSQDVIDLEDGERVILTFSGEKPFMFVQETINTDKEQISSIYGDPLVLAYTIGAVTDNSITWLSNGVEYYVFSDALTNSELLEVALSVSSVPVMK